MVTTDMFEESENRKAFEDMLAKRRNGAKDMFHYQTPQEQVKQNLYKASLAKMVDEAITLPARIESVLDLLADLGSPEEIKNVLYSLGMDSDKMKKGHSSDGAIKAWDRDAESKAEYYRRVAQLKGE